MAVHVCHLNMIVILALQLLISSLSSLTPLFSSPSLCSVVHARTAASEQESPRGLRLTRGSVWSSPFNQEISPSPCLKSKYVVFYYWIFHNYNKKKKKTRGINVSIIISIICFHWFCCSIILPYDICTQPSVIIFVFLLVTSFCSRPHM